ncbi:hypothetical protein D3C79_1001440 [compost metagenome]
MAYQLLEGLIGHHHLVGTATVDEAHDLAVDLKQEETLWVLRDTGADLFKGRGFIPLVRANFNLVAAFGILGNRLAKMWGAHAEAPEYE